ncbi:transcriptional antiterminator [Lactiplantibacillus paraplantarum]|uniref:Transcriptional antiterminator n=1 Tax=Lactiplantibacillus paraplantarum TaxID=60520 RepID=A0ABQ0NF64_9LACO|nr:PRD domain-containing protein [Lactiplantibacillus paraplantarum]GBF03708.1 transcriptional antiterminator [Lactiplantibacillus paraplantarum]
MKIRRILTNNAVVVGQGSREKILCGKGIGFNTHKGGEVNESFITQSFVLNSNGETNNVESLVKGVPLNFINIADDVRKTCELELGKKFNSMFVITLADHLYSAIIRLKKGVKINNLLTYDIQNYYASEFEIAQSLVKKLSVQFKLKIPIDEAGFIALHIVNAQFDDKSSMDNAYHVTKLIQDILTIVKYHFSVMFDASSIYYYRFITHLKFFAYRLLNHEHPDSNVDEDLYEMIEKNFIDSLNCAKKIQDFILNNYKEQIDKDELCYLSIHIHRLVTKAIT